MNIDSTVLDALGNTTTDGNSLKLTGKLDRPLYVAVNKVLEAAGGKWNRKAQAHLFDDDAGEIMDQIILTGKVTNKKQELGFFPTPPEIVARMIEAAHIEDGHSILEPSAGDGAILRHLHFPNSRITAVEIDHDRTAIINMATRIRYADFLSLVAGSVTDKNTDPWEFDRILMNPPFAKQADIRHVIQATNFLKPQGRLVAIMSSSVTFRTNNLTRTFREFLANYHSTVEALPENSFAESGTGINTVMVTLDR